MLVGLDKVLARAEEALQKKPQASLQDHLDLFKKFLRIEDQRLAMQHHRELAGVGVCVARAQLLDALLGRIYHFALQEYSEKFPADTSRCALVAVGGYGRGELNFHSDIDLMFLFADKVDGFGKFLLNKVLYLLWDLGMIVGHSARTIQEALQICSTDLVSRTALFEARFLAGDASIFYHLQNKLEERFARVPKVLQSYIAQKNLERQERHTTFGASMYLQEPNIKESIGGIRDLHNVFWVLRLKYGSIDLGRAVLHQLISEREAQTLRQSYDFLLAVRNALHLISGKKMDILMRAYQPRIAAAFGFKDQGDRKAAELFMKKYYLTARTIAFTSESILSKLKEPPSLAERSLQFLRRKELEHGLVQIDDTIYLGKASPESMRKDPLLMLRLFLVAQQRGASLHEDLKTLIRNHLYLIENKFQTSPAAASLFREILAQKGKVGPVLRTMHDIGFLGKYIPEFGKITCHVQDSEYHLYTTDEHTLKAIENVDDLFTARSKVHPIIVQVAMDLPHPELLYFSLILHDLGKLDPDDHVSLGLVMAQRILKRMGFSPEESELVLFLIREHLSLSHIAQRRDLDDPTTIMDFSVLGKTVVNLQSLLILTYADGQAVAPGIWTPWKEALIVELYTKTIDWLSGNAPSLAQAPMILQATQEKVCQVLQGEIPGQHIELHLQQMPSRYPLFTPVELIAKHVRMVAGLIDHAFLVQSSPLAGSESILEVTICTKDRLGLFELFAGCFTLNGINIISAQINTRRDGIVLDTFIVSDSSQTLPIQPRAMEKFKQCLAGALDETLDLVAALKRHEDPSRGKSAPTHKIPPVVLLDNRISETKTVLEIQAMDRLGLLFHVSKVLATLQLNISAAKISTERALAYDVFYITDSAGQKITDEQVQNTIRETLKTELAPE